MTEMNHTEEPLSDTAKSYLRRLRPAQRAVAREWALEDDEVFKMRIGVALDQLSGSGSWFKVLAGAGVVAGGAVGGFAATVGRAFLGTMFGG